MFAKILANQPFGVSTGYLEQQRGDWPRLVWSAVAVSRDAAELSALSWPELPSLVEFLRTCGRLPFQYLSIHAPTKDRGDFTEWTLAESIWPLAADLDGLVVHPDTVDEWRPLRLLRHLVLIENMDDRKAFGKTVDELDHVFANMPDAGFCLDVPHAASVDPSMELAHELVTRFGDRLRQLHLSSLDDTGHHIPLTVFDQERFADVLFRCREVPWILEAFESEDGSDPNAA